MFWNVPNLITIGRLAVVPILAWLLSLSQDSPHEKALSFWAGVLFAVAAISDVVDGHYARKYGQVSTAGKFFDPMADKLIHMVAMVYLVALMRFPAWLCVLLLFREIFITGLRSMAAGEGIVIPADILGKRKTLFLNIGLSGMILEPAVRTTFLDLPFRVIWFPAMVIGSVLAIVSGARYSWRFFRLAGRTW